MKTLASLLLALCALVCSCSSREEQIADLGKTTAHNWLEWKYNTSAPITYSDEVVRVTENSLTGDYWVSYTANVQCIAHPLKNTTEFVDDSVRLEFEYISSEDRCLLKYQSLTPRAK